MLSSPPYSFCPAASYSSEGLAVPPSTDRLFDDLVGSVWQNTRVANEEHLRILRAGVDHWNGWRNSNRAVTPDLSEADLFRANLSNADMSNADLHAADLRAATLSNLRYAN